MRSAAKPASIQKHVFLRGAASGVPSTGVARSRSLQDVGFEGDQVVVGEVGDVRFRLLFTQVFFQRRKLRSIVVPGGKKEEKTERDALLPNAGIKRRGCHSLRQPTETSSACISSFTGGVTFCFM